MKFRAGGSAYIGSLPLGCRLCGEGAKLVVFITGLCLEKCYYCPISFKRWGRDNVYANEMLVRDISEFVLEALNIDAKGASITGGEPLLKVERVVEAIEMLKYTFTKKFHIHLYTSGRLATPNILKDLERAGLDEVRFHIIGGWGFRRVEDAVKNTCMDVGVEVPCIPGSSDFLKKIILEADKLKVKFVNINELEVSERNINSLIARGLSVDENYPVVVKGSRELGFNILRWAEEEGIETSVHFCTARFKDAVQTRRRMLRRAKNVKKPYQKLLDEGLLEEIVVEVGDVGAVKDIISTLKLHKPYYEVEELDKGGFQVKIHPRLYEEVGRLGFKVLRRVLQPSHDQLVVLEEHLNSQH